jgi:multidrug efflux pump subunit AcrA (membrane-fusion protein)
VGGLALAVDAGEPPRRRNFSPEAEVAMIGSGVALMGLGIWGMQATRTIVTDVTPSSVSVSYNGEF